MPMFYKYFKIFIDSQWVEGTEPLEVIFPYTGETIFTTTHAGENQIKKVLKNHQENESYAQELTRYTKRDILEKTVNLLKSKEEDFALTIAVEAGKPLTLARAEVQRAILTFKLACDLTINYSGEAIHLDLMRGLEGKMGWVNRWGIGTVLAITPFNFPLNLVAHKVAPAVAAGCPIILKPSSKTPITAIKLVEVLLEAGFPPELLAVVPCENSLAQKLVESDVPKLLTFTGSAEVGWNLRSLAGKKKVLLELGGDAAVYIHKDANLELAAKRCAYGAFAYAGQVCISVQRIYIHQDVYLPFLEQFTYETEKIKTGDVLDERTICGPIIDNANYKRVLRWIAEAEKKGAVKITGGEEKRNNIISPCILENVNEKMTIGREEAFAPVANVFSVEDENEAIRKINQSRYGLQAAIFSNQMELIKKFYHKVQVGGIIVNDTPSLRVDNMPYGGVKDSGMGREGVKYAYEEMTEIKSMIW
ncbi:MAG: aldehyde dehydrogenase [Bacteroidia bacterium]|nr:MAG: aldehyde dehydrogenase [Bacteroidia bacterium]